MPLPAGTKLGHYEILSPLGAGGMGEVYRARDTRLKRDVALKILPEAFASDPGRMMRFQREAEVLASLNHPNIAQIYGVEERALAMELVEGESPKGPIPFESAWKIATQIANALEYAHDKGVIHRDLKPANVKVTPEGVVKLLDFGLAKAYSGQPDNPSGDPSLSPTITLGATVAGTILGTAAYMSPEQARGKNVDKRADIWAWGVVLYELLTGDQMFQGEDAAETLGAVMHKQPDLERVPPQARKLLGECLQKDPKLRLRDIGDAKRMLEEGAPKTTAPSGRGSAWTAWGLAAALGLSAAALAVVSFIHFREEPAHLVRFSFPPPEKANFPPNVPTMAVSPDGRRVAFEVQTSGKRELWARDLADPAPRMLAELEQNVPEIPFWAPDSRRLAFFDGSKLKKIDVTGGPAVTIADTGTTGFNGAGSGSWNQDDVIVLGAVSSPLFRVPAAGGTLAPVTEFDKARGETGHWAPWFLPDGRHFLYLTITADPEKSGVYIGDLSSKTRKQALGFGTRAIYVNPGYLMFVRDRTLMAQPFSASKLETTGDAVPVAEQVDTFTAVGPALGHFSASQNGVLMYTAGSAAGNVQLTWFDRTGKNLGTEGAPGNLEWFSLSPDGASIALTRRDPQNSRYDIWTRDLVHQPESRLTTTANNRFPVWSADGTRIFFISDRDGAYKIYQQAANGTGQAEVVSPVGIAPTDASRDGRYLLAVTSNAYPKTGNDVWVLPLFGDRKAFPYLATEFAEVWPRLSPDGRWLAYQSNATKRMEVYVVSFPQPGGKWQVSTNGGIDPVWSRDGRELYYYSADNKITVVDIKPGSQFQYGEPKALFEFNISRTNTSFDVSKDGRFLLPALAEQAAAAPMTVVLNWPQLLKK